jgi:hypothetical protein
VGVETATEHANGWEGDELTYEVGNGSVFKHHTMKAYRDEEVIFILAPVMWEWSASCSSYLYFQGKSSGTLPRLFGPKTVLITVVKTN